MWMYKKKIKWKNVFLILSLGLNLALLNEIKVYDELVATKDRSIHYLQNTNDELSVSVIELNASLLEDYETIFELAGYSYNIDPILLEAISRWETGHFKSDIYKEYNNAWGAMYQGKPIMFRNVEHSIIEMARTLRNNYINEGYTTIEQIGTKYCPDTHASWSAGVRSLYEEIKEGRY